MKKIIFMSVTFLLFVALAPLKTIYASESAYANMQKKEPTPSIRDEILKYDDSGSVTLNGHKVSTAVWDWFWQTYVIVKELLPLIICIPIIIGVIFVMCARRNKGFRRFCIVTFIITIPLLGILYVYGIPSMKLLFQAL